jgi:hypothetical protein
MIVLDAKICLVNHEHKSDDLVCGKGWELLPGAVRAQVSKDQTQQNMNGKNNSSIRNNHRISKDIVDDR